MKMHIFQLNTVTKLSLDETELAENIYDYFVNIASKLKKPIEHNDFEILREHINSKILENMHFELPTLLKISFLSSCQQWTFQNQLASMA